MYIALRILIALKAVYIFTFICLQKMFKSSMETIEACKAAALKCHSEAHPSQAELPAPPPPSTTHAEVLIHELFPAQVSKPIKSYEGKDRRYSVVSSASITGAGRLMDARRAMMAKPSCSSETPVEVSSSDSEAEKEGAAVALEMFSSPRPKALRVGGNVPRSLAVPKRTPQVRACSEM